MGAPLPTDIVGDHNKGQNISISITTDTGQVIPAASLGLVMKFSSKLINDKQKLTPISHGGKTRVRNLPEGWQGDIEWARVNGNVKRFVLAYVNYFRETGNIRLFSLNVTILNPNGTTEEYLYKNCSLGDFDAGSWEGNKHVTQGLPWEAEDCVEVSANTPVVAGTSPTSFTFGQATAIGI